MGLTYIRIKLDPIRSNDPRSATIYLGSELLVLTTRNMSSSVPVDRQKWRSVSGVLSLVAQTVSVVEVQQWGWRCLGISMAY